MVPIDVAIASDAQWPPWSVEPAIVLPLALAAVWYCAGVARLWLTAGVNHGIRRWQAACGGGGLVVLALSLLSPLHELGETIFSAHMVQHELLMVVAAPLLALGRPQVAAIWVLPLAWRKKAGAVMHVRGIVGIWRGLQQPWIASLLQAIAIVLWHLPKLYDAAVTNDAVHAAQHLSFLLTALLFWWVLIERNQSRSARGRSLLHLIATTAYTGALGAFLTFSTPLYPAYHGAVSWGLTPLEDQQLAGLIMWIPAGMVYLAAIIATMAAWVGPAERHIVRPVTQPV